MQQFGNQQVIITQQLNQTIFTAGKTQKNTTAFNDSFSLGSLGGNHKIGAISVFTDNKKDIYGIQFDYSAPGFGGKLLIANGQQYLCSKPPHNLLKELFVLDPKEYVTNVFGRAGNSIEAIGFKTSFGRSFEVGGKDGQKFEFAAPLGYHFHNVSGGVGDKKLDTITFEATKIPN